MLSRVARQWTDWFIHESVEGGLLVESISLRDIIPPLFLPHLAVDLTSFSPGFRRGCKTGFPPYWRSLFLAKEVPTST